MLKGKHILLGITGSIAAYKAAMLVRLLVKEGAEVKVIMTEMAKQFITPLTMATLAKNPVLVEFYNPENGDWNSHVSLGIWADLFIIAPASANTIAKMAGGIADNLLLTSYLSARCPVFVAPAMDLDMFMHPVTRKNINLLKQEGVKIIEPESGELASGLEGKGRMADPAAIVTSVSGTLLSIPKEKEEEKDSLKLRGKNVLITAGPTVEKIDPVRYISNFSTGKMGYALALQMESMGAAVTLISGPVQEKIPAESNIKLINTTSAEEMYNQTLHHYNNETDIVILAAAVSDYTPAYRHQDKMKRDKNNLNIELRPTQDIAAELGKIKNERALHIGFALETDNEQQNAEKKLVSKNLDAIILNSLNDKGAGFATPTNKITIITSNGKTIPYDLKEKSEVAKDIADYILTTL
jgi:phosphopantothenoylcysteine decarboxylase/phosphopantothenate--cysteine ligase